MVLNPPPAGRMWPASMIFTNLKLGYNEPDNNEYDNNELCDNELGRNKNDLNKHTAIVSKIIFQLQIIFYHKNNLMKMFLIFNEPSSL